MVPDITPPLQNTVRVSAPVPGQIVRPGAAWRTRHRHSSHPRGLLRRVAPGGYEVVESE
jgi:hypothetical protein